MRREPPSHQRRVALAGIDVHPVVGIFSVAMDDVFAVECVVRFKMVRRLESRLYRRSATPGGGQPAGVESSIRQRLSQGSRTAVRYRGQQ